MKPSRAVANGFYHRYSEFRGRSSRAEFWWCVAALFLANALLMLVAWALPSAGSLVSSCFALAIMIPYAAMLVRRLHDIGWSGWWVAGVFSLSLAASAMAAYEALAWMPLVSAAGFLALLALCALPGQKGPNRYGPVPEG